MSNILKSHIIQGIAKELEKKELSNESKSKLSNSIAFKIILKDYIQEKTNYEME